MSLIQEWRNAGETSHYPFVETATLASVSGNALPRSFLVDASLIVPATEGRVYLSNLLVVGHKVVGTIKQDSVVVGTFVFTHETLAGGSADVVSASGQYRGTLVAGKQGREIFQAMPVGHSLFNEFAARFEPSVILPVPPRALTGIQVVNDTFNGKVAFVEGRGVKLIKMGSNRLKISAVGSPAGLEECCDDVTGAFEQISVKLTTGDTVAVVPNQYGAIRMQAARFSEPATVADPRQNLRVNVVENGIEIFLASSK